MIFIGFSVRREDFIETLEPDGATCPAGHRQTGEDAFCSKDGGKFEPRKTERATPALRDIYKFFGYNFREEGSPEEQFRSLRDGGEPVYSVEVKVGYSWKTVISVGLKVCAMGHETGMRAIDDEDLRQKWEKVEALRDALGMKDRPIQLIHTVELS